MFGSGSQALSELMFRGFLDSSYLGRAFSGLSSTVGCVSMAVLNLLESVSTIPSARGDSSFARDRWYTIIAAVLHLQRN